MLDLGNFESDLSSSEFSDVFTYSNPLLKVCLNLNKANNILSNLPSGVQNDCNEVHLRLNRKKIFEKDIYLYSCGDDFIHKFEYNNICYESCPSKTQTASELGTFTLKSFIADSVGKLKYSLLK